MASPKIDDQELLDRLTHVFRAYGFEGASLSRISEATGLQRASLYHRFPGGKEEMVAAVLARAADWLGEHALGPLRGSGTPVARLRRMTKSLREFYRSGRESCLLDALSFADATAEVQATVSAAMKHWLETLRTVAREGGLNAAAARGWAEDTVVRIQGALVVSRSTGHTQVFERVLREIPGSLEGREDQ